MKRILGFILAIVALPALAQQPQTQTAPIFDANAKYVNGVAPGYWPTAGSGLTLNLSAGTANCSGTIATYAAGTLTMTASTTNYVYLSTASSCVPAVKTTAFVAADIPIAEVVASGTAITPITDVRTMYFVAGTSSGAGLSVCADTSGSGTAQSCTPSPAFTPTTNSCMIYTTTTTNSGTSLTLNVGGIGAKSVAKWQGAITLAAGDVPANKPVVACYDGADWNLSTIGNAPTGGGGSFPSGATGGAAYYNGSAGAISSDVTVDQGGTPNLAVGANVPGISIDNGQATTVSNLSTLTTSNSILAVGSFVRVTDGAYCGDTATGSGSVKETLECTALTSGSCSAWSAFACSNVASPSTPVPESISGLAYWWGADQAPAQTNNTAMLRWYSPFTGNMLTSNSSGPTFLTNQLNSLPAVSFPGTSAGRMTIQYPVGLNQSTTFVVFNPASFSAYCDFFSGATGALLLRFNQTTAHLDLEKTFTSTIATDTTTLTASTWYGATVTYDGVGTGNYAFRVNGAASSSGTNLVAITANTSSVAYNQQGTNEDFNGSIAEIIVYNRVLTSGEITTVESYLHSKWGVY
ncbi:MAG TPA: LamG-like jellyroll fold domain-containing protein [Acidobacteriaceae bacterium]|nr:LamG-like jellyroll fold domain-containing protein [Acidobacteriaceae bacterium]